jgi:hypothetical protein
MHLRQSTGEKPGMAMTSLPGFSLFRATFFRR